LGRVRFLVSACRTIPSDHWLASSAVVQNGVSLINVEDDAPFGAGGVLPADSYFFFGLTFWPNTWEMPHSFGSLFFLLPWNY